MTERGTYTADDIVNTIRTNHVDTNNMLNVERMLNYDYINMNPSDFDKLVTNVEQRNSHPVSEEDKVWARNHSDHIGAGSEPRDTAQGLGDIAVHRDSKGHVKNVVVNDSQHHSWLGAEIVGTRVFDRSNPEMVDTGRALQNYFDQTQQPKPYYESPAKTAEQFKPPCPFNEMERQVRQQLVDESIIVANKGDSWRSLAHRLDPTLDHRDQQAFATYLKHINGNRKWPLIDEKVATRSAVEIDNIVRDHMDKVMYGTERYKY